MAALLRSSNAPVHSLASARPGDLVEVVHILFGSLRQRCDASGIRVGTKMRFRGRTPERLVLELVGGGIAEVDVVHAPFVEVRPLSGDLAWSTGGPAPRSATVTALHDRSAAKERIPNPKIA